MVAVKGVRRVAFGPSRLSVNEKVNFQPIGVCLRLSGPGNGTM
jgi:hypothetical protein